MSEEHVCEWFRPRNVVVAYCRGCPAMMGIDEQERRLNATEIWTPDDARRLSSTCMSMQEKAIHGKGYPSLRESAVAYWKSRVVKLLSYANTLEGK